MKKQATGFTLIEMLTVIAIIVILFALLLPVLSLAQRKSKITATQTTLGNLIAALNSYHTDWGVYPVQAPHTGQVIDLSLSNGAASDPGYYNVPCAQPPTGTDPSTGQTSAQYNHQEYSTNGALIKILANNKYMEINPTTVINLTPGYPLTSPKVLLDNFGSPIIVRFLILGPPAGNVTSSVLEKVYAWSYGYNMKNAIKASQTYLNHGATAYDSAEEQSMNTCTIDDDICSWR